MCAACLPVAFDKRAITDREAHFLAKAIGEDWLEKFRDSPSEQLWWHTEIYPGMWGAKYLLGHDDAGRISRQDVIRVKDHRLGQPSRRTGKQVSAKAVKDSDLTALRTVFDWAVTNGKIANNPAAGISIRLGKKPRLRSKSFTDDEAKAILAAALKHARGSEAPKTFAARRWIPWLCAFTGARVGELAQLRKQGVFQQNGRRIIRIP